MSIDFTPKIAANERPTDNNKQLLQQLLAVLHRGGQFGYYWTLPEQRSYWYAVGKKIDVPITTSVYFGVNPCSAIPATNTKGESVSASKVRGQLSYIASVNTLFGEFDAKDFSDSKDAALEHIHLLTVQPSVIIDSGGGYHCYWLLDAPFLISTDENREHIDQLQKAWVKLIGSDDGAKDLARVLRVPGTMNRKYDPPRPVAFIEADFDRIYSVSDLAVLVADTPKKVKVGSQVEKATQAPLSVSEDQVKRAASHLDQLALWRCDDYNAWIGVGMALSELGSAGLDLWDKWSQKSPKYRPGRCQLKWSTFTLGVGIKLGSLKYWADEDKHSATTLPAQESNKTENEQAHIGKSSVPTHDELAQEWYTKHPNTAYGMGNYWRYSEGVWNPLSDDAVRAEILRTLQEAKPRGIKPTESILVSVMKLASAMYSVQDCKWDANPEILVLLNGTLHIPSMTLREHNPEDYQTSSLPYAYNSEAKAEVFEKTIRTILPEEADFLQEYFGYCLTTDTRHEIAVWFYGPPGSGKSTIITGLQTALGHNWNLKKGEKQHGRVGNLGLADIERSSFALTNIVGKTLLISTEQPGNFMKSTHILNALISGEVVNVDRKFKDMIEIVSNAKLLWAMNELPRVGDASNGLFRRVKVVKFPPLHEQRNPEIKESIKLEGAGILNWALRGLDRLQERGYFEIPNSITTATEDFQLSNDVPAMFVAECCTIDDAKNTQSSVLYQAYSDWCKANNHKPQSSTTMATDWQLLGYTQYMSNGRVHYRGVGLLKPYAYPRSY